MWEQYKKTAPVMQATIIAASIIIYFITGRLWFVALMFFVMMQIGALLGAAWGARLKSRIQGASNDLPLNRRPPE